MSKDQHLLKVIKLPPVLDLEAAAGLKDELLNTLKTESKGCALDGTEVRELLSPTLHVLLSASQAFQASNLDFKVVNSSKFFAETLSRLNLSNKITIES